MDLSTDRPREIYEERMERGSVRRGGSLRVVRRSDEVMIQRLIHFLAYGSMFRIEYITFGRKEIIREAYSIEVFDW